MFFDKGKLEKLTLRAFKPSTRNDEPPQPSSLPADTYVAQVNPSAYTLSKLINYTRHRGQGSASTEAVFSDSPPINLAFEFLFDGTGVIPQSSELGDIPLVGAIASALSGSKKFDVMTEIKRFDELVYQYQGERHRPRPLQLVWGSLVMPVVLSSVSYRFTLFKPDGTPLRAIASCSFCESVPPALSERKKNPMSPDLTHLRDVCDGDSLPLLSQEIYGNSELYLEVARANKLVNFRKLKSASRLAFPPLKSGGAA
jgi:hypothetical protein